MQNVGGGSPEGAAVAAPSTQQSPSAGAKPRGTRTRRSAGQTGRRGRLEKLPHMPLDILFEIFSHLEPIDLLHLARTNKSFRALLVSRRSTALWRAARRNIPDLPECPEDISEPALANLLFLSNCHGCNKPNTQRIFWDCGFRYCKKCEEPLKKATKWWSGCLVTYAFEPLELSPDIGEMQLYELIRVFTDEVEKPFYYCPLTILQHDVDEMRATLLNMTVDERSKYLQDRKARRNRWMSQIIPISRWFLTRSASRKNELGNVREMRIREKLEVLGWGDDLRAMNDYQSDEFKKLPAIRVSKPLTDRAWANASPSILAFLEKVREARLENERDATYRKRMMLFQTALGAIHNYRPGEPSDLDVAFGLPRVRELVQRPVGDALSDASFAFLRDALPPFVAQWKQDARATLRRVARRDTGLFADDDPDPLALADGQWFRCRTCGTEAGPRDIVSHRCRFDARAHSTSAFSEAALHVLEHVHWNPRAVELVRDFAPVIRWCGLEPRSATLEDLDRCKVRFECEACSPEEGVKVMAWYSAAMHERAALRRTDTKCKLYLLPDDIARAARCLQRTLRQHSDGTGAGGHHLSWKCLVCRHTTRTWVKGISYSRRTIEEHLQDEHGIYTPVEDEHFREADVKQFRAAFRDVYLIADVYSEPRLKRRLPWLLKDALREGRAEFFAFPEDDEGSLPEGPEDVSASVS